MDKLNIYLIIALLLFILGIVSFINSSFFEIREIEIIDNNLLTREKIIEEARIDDTSANIFYLNYQKLAQNLTDLPQIRGVKIDRRWPNKLEIKINERRPLLTIEDETEFMIAKDRKKLGYHEQLGERLPKINLEDYEIEDERVEINDEFKENFTNALEILYNLDDMLLKEITEFKFEEEIILILSNGGRVKFGNDFDLQERAESFSLIFSDLEAKSLKIEYIDLRYGRNIAVKTK